jgi:hypothetical protein
MPFLVGEADDPTVFAHGSRLIQLRTYHHPQGVVEETELVADLDIPPPIDLYRINGRVSLTDERG